MGDRLQRLLDEGHRVEVLAAGDGSVTGDIPSVTVDGRLTVRRLPASTALFYREGAPEALERGGAIWLAAAQFSTALAAAARQRRRHWDMVESHWLVPSALAASAAAPSHPRRAFAHSGDVALLERIPFGRAIARRLARDGTRLRFVSADLQSRFARLCGETANIGNLGTVETLDVPATLFSPRMAPDATLRRRLGVGGPTVLAVGRLVPIKGHAALLHGCARARAWSPAARHAEVVILGDGPERARLTRLAAALEVPLRLVGMVPRAEVADWLRAADLFAHPSARLANGRTEGAPIAAREAHAVGIPVVVSNEVGTLARAIGALALRGRVDL